MGNPKFAINPLKSLLASNHEIVAVISNPPKPMGRKKILQHTDIGKFALENNLNLIELGDFNNRDIFQKIAFLNVDIFVVVAFILAISHARGPAQQSARAPIWRGGKPFQRQWRPQAAPTKQPPRPVSRFVRAGSSRSVMRFGHSCGMPAA